LGTLIVFVVFYGLHALGILSAQRYLHHKPITQLGFQAPIIRHLLIGFLGGFAFGLVKRVAAILASGSFEIQWSVPAEISILTLTG